MTITLTATSIRNLPKVKKPTFFGFTGVKRIKIRKTPNGTLTWYISYNFQGKNKRVSVGRYKTARLDGIGIDINEIQVINKRYHEQTLAGIDPRTGKRAGNTTGTNHSPTVRQLLDIYYIILEQQGTRSIGKIKRLLEKNIISIVDMPVADVSKDDIRQIFNVINQRNALWTKRHFHTYIRKMFEIAADWIDYEMHNKPDISFGIEYSPVPKMFPLTIAQKEQAREQLHLSFTDINLLVNDERIDEITRLHLKLCLSTGQRLRQIREATWDEIDFIGDKDADLIVGYRGAKWTWAKSQMKKKEPHAIPLTPLHITILNRIKEISPKSRYLFPHTKDTSRPVDSNDLYSPVINHQARIRQRDLADKGIYQYLRPIIKENRKTFYQPHETRHTFKTLSAALKISKDDMDRVQHHAVADTSNSVYNQYSYMNEKLVALTIWCDTMQEVFRPDWKADNEYEDVGATHR